MAIIDILGMVGGMIISLSLIPQVYKTYQTKDASSISYTYQFIYIIGCTLINIYAIYTKLWIIYVPCIIEQIMIVMLTIMKVRYASSVNGNINVDHSSDNSSG
jgi:MtN3 and saliva related transmembrane protein|eukprot:285725_1